MKLQCDIPEEVNKELKIFKVRNNFKSMADAVNFILRQVLFSEEVKREVFKE